MRFPGPLGGWGRDTIARQTPSVTRAVPRSSRFSCTSRSTGGARAPGVLPRAWAPRTGVLVRSAPLGARGPEQRLCELDRARPKRASSLFHRSRSHLPGRARRSICHAARRAAGATRLTVRRARRGARRLRAPARGAVERPGSSARPGAPPRRRGSARRARTRWVPPARSDRARVPSGPTRGRRTSRFRLRGSGSACPA